MKISEVQGNLFDAPEDAVLIRSSPWHSPQAGITSDANIQFLLIDACNCHGIWGGGIAKTFSMKVLDSISIPASLLLTRARQWK